LAYATIGLEGIALADAVSYAACIALLSGLRISRVERLAGWIPPAAADRRKWIDDMASAHRWIARQPKLLGVLLFFLANNVAMSIFAVLYSPYFLSFGTPGLLASMLAVTSAGAVAGGLVFSTTGGFRRMDRGILVGSLLCGLCMVGTGLTHRTALLAVAAFAYGGSIPIINASSQTLWQAKVPPEMQGRIFSFRRMVAWMMNPFAMLFSIPAAHALSVLLPPASSASSGLAGIWDASPAGSLGLLATLCGAYSSLLAAVLLLVDGLAVESSTDPPALASDSHEALHPSP
jgi:DHA3 family macrolide efflux protein-like MFS transporter